MKTYSVSELALAFEVPRETIIRTIAASGCDPCLPFNRENPVFKQDAYDACAQAHGTPLATVTELASAVNLSDSDVVKILQASGCQQTELNGEPAYEQFAAASALASSFQLLRAVTPVSPTMIHGVLPEYQG